LFRPFHSVTSKESGEGFDSERPPSSFSDRFEQQQQEGQGTSASSSGHRHDGRNLRPRSPASNPLPPQYSSSILISHDDTADRRQFGSRSSSPSPQSSSTSRIATSTEHGTEFSRGTETRRQQSTEERDDESFDFDYEGANDIDDGTGIPLEEEVDRLLNEMSPDDANRDLEKGSR
jgi:hypothetical protein